MRLNVLAHPLPMNCGQPDVVLGEVEPSRAVAPRIPICWQPVRREASQRVPPLVLVDVEVLRILHRVDPVLAGARRRTNTLKI